MWAELWGKRRDSLIGICPDYENLSGWYYKNLTLKDLTPYSYTGGWHQVKDLLKRLVKRCQVINSG